MQKNRKTIALLGENTSQPDLVVPDGACEKISNLRFRNGSWQSVGHIINTTDEGIIENDVVTVNGINARFLGKHEVDGEEHFFYCFLNKKVGIYVSVYSQGESSILLTIPSKSDVQNVTFFSFGNIAIISHGKQSHYFIWSKGTYTEFNMPSPANIKEKRVSTFTPVYTVDDTKYHYFKLMDYDSKEILVTTSKDNGWVGEICYLVAYKMVDGTIITPSNLRIFCTEEKDINPQDIRILRIPHYENGVLSNSAYSLASNRKDLSNYAKHFAFSYPRLRITIPNDIDASLVDRVCVFSTRINSFIDFERLSKIVLSVAKDVQSSFSQSKYLLKDIYADNELPNQPLCLVAEKNIKNMPNGVWDIDLTYPLLKDLATKSSVYSAPQMHKVYAEAMYDYNQRLHLANLTSELYSHQSSLIPHISQNGKFKEAVKFNSLGKVVFSQPITQPVFADEAEENTYPIEYPSAQWYLAMNGNIISYPDYRASSVTAFQNGEDEAEESSTIQLRSAPANNFAYYIAPSLDDFKYPFEEFEIGAVNPAPLVEDNILSEPNRLQVSAPNNPFNHPFENSYKVGNEGTKIVAINSVADTLVESNFFGAYPLYIFSSDGIFALSAGSGNILYGSTEIVNHDIITNPHTLAANGAVIYADSEGIKALSGRTSTLISADIETPSAMSNKWSNATFAISRLFNELLAVDNEGVLHIFNISNKVWSQRTLPSSSSVTLCGDYLALSRTSSMSLFAINNEEAPTNSTPLSISIVTRPIKFDSQSLKGLATLVARWKAEVPASVTIFVDTSLDCVTWSELSSASFVTDKQFGLRMTPASARFFRIKIEGNVVSHSTLLSMDADVIYKYSKHLM